MPDLYRRKPYRGLYRVLFGALLVLSFFLFVLWRTENPRLQRVRVALVDAVSPALETVAGPSSAVGDLFEDVRSLGELQSENARLREQLERSRGWRDLAQRLEEENARLRALNAVKLPPRIAFVTAEVIGDGGGPYAQSVLVNVGRDDGVAEGAPALDAGGLVGRVAGSGERASRILLVTDATSRMPVTVGANRVQAIMVGDDTGAPQLLHMLSETQVAPGDLVTTSGEGDVLPRGLLVGRIAAPLDGAAAPVAAGAQPARVALAANLDQLDFVRILRRSGELDAPGPAALVTRPAAAGFAAEGFAPEAPAPDAPAPEAAPATPTAPAEAGDAG